MCQERTFTKPSIWLKESTGLQNNATCLQDTPNPFPDENNNIELDDCVI